MGELDWCLSSWDEYLFQHKAIHPRIQVRISLENDIAKLVKRGRSKGKIAETKKKLKNWVGPFLWERLKSFSRNHIKTEQGSRCK